jgi:hypothetical protein
VGDPARDTNQRERWKGQRLRWLISNVSVADGTSQIPDVTTQGQPKSEQTDAAGNHSFTNAAPRWPMPRAPVPSLMLPLLVPARAAPAHVACARAALVVLALVGLTGCVAAIAPPVASPINVDGAVMVGSVAAFGRTPVDAAYSLLTGKDCSVVHWDQGKGYCRASEPLPDALPYCTRSLGVVDCWRDPAAEPNLGPDVAEGARALTPAQEKDRTRGWVVW